MLAKTMGSPYRPCPDTRFTINHKGTTDSQNALSKIIKSIYYFSDAENEKNLQYLPILEVIGTLKEIMLANITKFLFDKKISLPLKFEGENTYESWRIITINDTLRYHALIIQVHRLLSVLAKEFYGFTDLHDIEKEEILGKTREISVNTSLSQDVLQLSSQEIEPGMSGSAVLDLETNRVVGIVFQHNDTRGTVDTNLNFAIPIESILKIPIIESALTDNNPGLNPRLSNVTEFLSKIRLEGELYQLIDQVYVPPVEYDEILNALTKDKIVFIVGTKEYGKITQL